MIPDFVKVFEKLEIDSHSYIVILTRGHLHDQSVLEQTLKTRPAYIGMIGSRTKRDKIYHNLMKKESPKRNSPAYIHQWGCPSGPRHRLKSASASWLKSYESVPVNTPADLSYNLFRRFF